MQTLQINFSDKEMEIIQLMKPDSTAEEIINIVLRDWFNSNVQRMHETAKTLTEKIDEVLAKSTVDKAKVDKAVVK